MRGVFVGSEHDNWPALSRALHATGRFASLRRVDPITDPQAFARLIRLHSPHLVVLDLASHPDLDSLLDLLARASPAALVVATGAGRDGQVLLQLMRVGVQEYLTIPYTQEEISGLLGRVEQRLAKQPTSANFTDLLFTWLPAKAGVGTSTLCVQISLALAQQFHKKALLVDLDLNNGLIAFLLRLKNAHSVASILGREFEFDEEFWDRLILKHNRLDVLASSESNSEGRIDPSRALELLGVARRLYEIVCVDLSGEMEEYSIAAMQDAKHVLLVCTPEAPVLHMARRRIARLRSLGLEDRVRVIVNRASANGHVAPGQIPGLLGREVFATIQNDYRSIGEALISGRRIDPKSALGRDISALAARLANQPPVPTPALRPLQKLLERLAALRKRMPGWKRELKTLSAQPVPAQAITVPQAVEAPLSAPEAAPEPAPPPPPPPVPLTAQEFDALLAACAPKRKSQRPAKGLSLHHCHALLLVIRQTGMGAEEALRLSGEDLEGCRLKGMELPESTAAELRTYVRPGGGGLFLDSDTGLGDAVRTLKKRMAEYGRRAGIQGPVLERLCAPPAEADSAIGSLRSLESKLEHLNHMSDARPQEAKSK